MDSIHFYFKVLYSRIYGHRATNSANLQKCLQIKKQHVLLIHTMKAQDTIIGNSHKNHLKLKQIESKKLVKHITVRKSTVSRLR